MKLKSKSLLAMVGVLTLSIPLAASADTDPFPGIAQGQEIPGSRVSSAPGESQESFDAGAGAGHSCPAGSGRGVGVDLAGTSNRSDDVRYYSCVKTWQSTDTTSAWDDYNQRRQELEDSAFAESLAWNLANPGKQKCVSWGPITDPNGGQSSGGVCANPIELEEGATLPSQDADGVGEEDVDVGGVPSATVPDPVTSDPESDSLLRGSGYPFTRIVPGQVGVSDCPAGYQAANGVIADASTRRTFTECWPQSAWTAYSLGGETWSLFKATDGTHNPNVEVERQAKIDLLVTKAKEIALAAAAQTPGIERCSSWSGFGESGRECAYAFIDPAAESAGVEVDLTSDEATQSEAEVGVGLDGAIVNGSALQIASTSRLLAPTILEATAVSSFVSEFSKLKTWQSGFGRNLPSDSDLEFSYKSLTPGVCKAVAKRIQIRKPNTCVIEVSVSDTNGNSYVTKKIFKRRYGK